MSVTSEKLSKSGAKSSDIDMIVREQLRVIDDCLLSHNRIWGTNTVHFELPFNPGVRGLDITDAQKIIYTQIMHNLESRGFDVKISIGEHKNVLYIYWRTDLDDEEVKAMNKYIQSHKIEEPPRNDRRGPQNAPRTARDPRDMRDMHDPRGGNDRRPRKGH